jgi:mannose-6-phosphate isomerase-like protein (cupin superfamily)
MTEPETYPYVTHLDIKFPALAVVDVPSVIRLGVMQGEYHWHKHDNDDEFFFVLDGHFIIDLEDRSVDLQRLEGFVVPKGVVHRTRAPDRAVILMAETSAIVPTGDG